MITVRIDTSRVHRAMSDLVEKNIPFAASRAINDTLFDARGSLSMALPHDFLLRNAFLRRSLRIDKSTKQNLRGEMGFLNQDGFNTDFMERQVASGTKRPKSGSNLAIPASSRGTTFVRQGQNSRGVIRRDRKPSALLADPKTYFKGIVKGRLGIWKRTGKRDAKGWPRPHLNLMYLLKPSTHVKARLPMESIVMKVVDRRFDHYFGIRLDEALK